MRKTLFVVSIAVVLAGCNPNKAAMPFFGKWIGTFTVTGLPGGSALDMKRESLKGYVQVYANRRQYKMEMEGEQETIDIAGTWTIDKNRITLTPKEIDIDDQGGAEKRDPNKKFIPADIARAAYARPLVLQESADKKSLTGLKTTIGDLVGTHHFTKDSF